MKQLIIFCCLAIFAINSYAQTNFDKGYFIDNDGQKTKCLIKNEDWKDNPTRFEYKISEEDELKGIGIESVAEFGVDNFSKYIRSTVDVDMSVYLGESSRLEETKDPVFVTKEIFLKTLVEGKASLYLYEKELLQKFFYQKEVDTIKQLVYRRYVEFTPLENRGNVYVYNTEKIKENNLYKQQLWSDFEDDTDIFSIQDLKYDRKALTSFFVKCNQSSNVDFIDYVLLSRIKTFNLTLRTRLNNSSLKMNYGQDFLGNIDLGNKMGFGFGIEAEIVLPFRKGRWTIPIEPTYQSFKTEKSIINRFGATIIMDVNYQSIELPLGARRYFFLNEKSKVFINGFLVLDFNILESSITAKTTAGFSLNTLKPQALANVALGAGYKYNDRYSVELRYLSNRNLALRNPFLDTYYETLSAVIGFTL